ncbi:hypothetical protein JAAARDRAFT_211291 [Jaapia argillacea MUCL 33604]|uniref:DUF6534 domain-containing protein n=1 Tax=Jaapia argillacea MUCL 33604 TaxID=933084 RepID=A0A067PL14_9AGAM|nr:hypothetical protein JAAARDRAFT_211291 [Jaapia argillacea MUCL 33604]
MAETVFRMFGPLLVGGLVALCFSGIVSMQAFRYFHMFSGDYMRVRATVSFIWILDITHSGLICASNWFYLIDHWGDSEILDHIPLSIALTIFITAAVTLTVHTFFIRRVLILSKKNWWLCAPLFVLAVLRFLSATTTTVLMIHLKHYSLLRLPQYTWVITFGLVMGSTLDILITTSLCLYLRSNRTGFSSMDYIIDTIMMYAINHGSLTCICTFISLLCWLAIPHSLAFLGAHFAISKLYANSFLATLNTRDTLRDRSQGSSDRGGTHQMPVIFPGSRMTYGRYTGQGQDPSTATKLEINVQKTIECEVNVDMEQQFDPIVHRQ